MTLPRYSSVPSACRAGCLVCGAILEAARARRENPRACATSRERARWAVVCPGCGDVTRFEVDLSPATRAPRATEAR